MPTVRRRIAPWCLVASLVVALSGAAAISLTSTSPLRASGGSCAANGSGRLICHLGDREVEGISILQGQCALAGETLCRQPATAGICRENVSPAIDDSATSRDEQLAAQWSSPVSYWCGPLSTRLSHRVPRTSSPIAWVRLGPNGHNVTANYWRQVGKVSALAVDWKNPAVMYAASGDWGYLEPVGEASGVYVTTNGGASWTLTSNGLLGARVNQLWVDPANPHVAIAAASNGLYRTSNFGATWTEAPTLTGPIVENVVNVASTLYAATPGAVFSSNDDGVTWSSVWTSPYAVDIQSGNDGGSGNGSGGYPLPNDGILQLATNGVRACAAASSLTVPSTHPAPVVIGCGVPGGAWSATASEPCPSHLGCMVRDLQLGRPGSNELLITQSYFSYTFIPPSSVYRSTNGGSSWTSLTGSIPVMSSLQILTMDPNNPSIMWAAGIDTDLYRTTNGGVTWHNFGQQGDMRTIAVQPGNSNHVILGTDQGIYGSSDIRTSPWRALSTSVDDAMVYSVTAAGTNVAAVIQDSNTPFLSSNLGTSWRFAPVGYEWGSALINPAAPRYQYLMSGGMWVSSNGGQSFTSLPATQRFSAMAVAPSAPNVVYGSTFGKLWRSTDWGMHFSLLHTIGGLNPGPFTSMIVDPQNLDHLLVGDGDGDGTVYSITNHGATVSAANMAGCPNVSALSSLSWVPSAPSNVLAGFFEDVCASTDGGASFHTADTGLPPTTTWRPGEGVSVVSFVPGVTTGAALLGLDSYGLFESTSVGGPWVSVQGAMASSTINAIAWSRGRAVLATFGAGVLRSAADLSTATIAAPPTCHVSAVAGQIHVSWTTPANSGGSPLRGYVVTLTAGALQPPSRWVGTAATSLAFPTTPHVTYHATVSALNDLGPGWSCVTGTLVGR